MKALLPPSVLTDKCIYCEHPIAAQSLEGLAAAKTDHVRYVNDRLPYADDPHFADKRLDRLVAQ